MRRELQSILEQDWESGTREVGITSPICTGLGVPRSMPTWMMELIEHELVTLGINTY